MSSALRRAILDAHAAEPLWSNARIAREVGSSKDSVRRALRFAQNIAAAAAGAPDPAPAAPAGASAGAPAPTPAQTAETASAPRRIAASALRPLSDEDWRHRPRGRDLLSREGF